MIQIETGRRHYNTHFVDMTPVIPSLCQLIIHPCAHS
jgi:hypothetical protein